MPHTAQPSGSHTWSALRLALPLALLLFPAPAPAQGLDTEQRRARCASNRERITALEGQLARFDPMSEADARQRYEFFNRWLQMQPTFEEAYRLPPDLAIPAAGAEARQAYRAHLRELAREAGVSEKSTHLGWLLNVSPGSSEFTPFIHNYEAGHFVLELRQGWARRVDRIVRERAERGEVERQLADHRRLLAGLNCDTLPDTAALVGTWVGTSGDAGLREEWTIARDGAGSSASWSVTGRRDRGTEEAGAFVGSGVREEGGRLTFTQSITRTPVAGWESGNRIVATGAGGTLTFTWTTPRGASGTVTLTRAAQR